MVQEDKGLVIRGLALLAIISVLVLFVLTLLFWRTPPAEQATEKTPPEYRVPLIAVPALAPYPSSVSWGAIAELGETSPSPPGWEIRYNAAATLARRGSASVPWGLIREMLDEKQQKRNYRVRQPNGRDIHDEAAARANMLSALRAVEAWHRKQKSDARPAVPAELREIYTIVDKLVETDFGEMKIQAEKTRQTFFR